MFANCELVRGKILIRKKIFSELQIMSLSETLSDSRSRMSALAVGVDCFVRGLDFCEHDDEMG